MDVGVVVRGGGCVMCVLVIPVLCCLKEQKSQYTTKLIFHDDPLIT